MQDMRIDLGRNLARSMMTELENTNKNGKAVAGHIPCVPANLRNVDNMAYEPKIISLGPYHHGKPSLQIMEDHKNRYIFEIINYWAASSSSNEKMIRLETIFNLVISEESKLRSLYTLPPNSVCDDFIKTMVLDSCFVLRFLIKCCMTAERKSDPLFEVGNILPLLRGDLLLLENQLPFYILEQLYYLIPKPITLQPFPTLKEIAFTFCTLKLSTDSVALDRLQPYHLLHLFNLILLPRPRAPSILLPKPRGLSTLNAPCTIPSAVKLRDVGIKISPKESDNLLDISYDSGKLEIPRLKIMDVTIPLFKNLIAFEQCSSTAGYHFTTYSRFWNLLVNRIEDVEILQEHGVLVNMLGNNEDVLKFFNEIFIQVVLDDKDHYLAQAFLDIEAYSQTRWKKQYAEFKQKYHSGQWEFNQPQELNEQERIMESAILAAANGIIDLRDKLNYWDDKVGDGVYGSNMYRGAMAILEDMKKWKLINLVLFRYAILCKAAYASLKGSSDITPEQWARALETSITAFSKYGRAEAGDASGVIRREYDAKCRLLRHQESRGESQYKIDKTRAKVKDLHSRVKVSIQRIDSISKKIEELRDTELQPQLEELIEGIAQMWERMLDCHKHQCSIISSASNIGSTKISSRSESYRQSAGLLTFELNSLCSSFIKWISVHKSYLEAINGWLHKCVFPLRHKASRGRKNLEFSPRRDRAPPIFVTCRDWLKMLTDLPTSEVERAIKNLSAISTDFLPHQEKVHGNRKLLFSLSKKAGKYEELVEDRNATSADSYLDLNRFQSGLADFLYQLKAYAESSVQNYGALQMSIEAARDAYERD
ncbi:hypothetical protein J5N97_024584 [Dioscorea zingiberensis]|uniref:DUF632 domain-containing protein n=1 Tax=Dioscorea zingiberensis TaxID=325984 RepID=A0A9D5H913_9LILI|nr:hypothetical protein J5N97_024584 [Dioscorea zingiberensis]